MKTFISVKYAVRRGAAFHIMNPDARAIIT
jgi:hypothetical protein